ncbi:MAG: preprotein translocase subunit SecG [Burkholderiales bacterium]|nr:preprotein translocase subunit SecG [Burkholderiales bacterium]
MQLLESILLMVHLLVALVVCGLVLLQHGKGADMGAAFGSGSSGSVFGAAGSANFLSRSTAILAAIFFASSLALTYLGTLHTRGNVQDGVMSTMPAAPAPKASDVPVPSTVPATPASGTAPAPATGTPPAPASTAAPTPPAAPGGGSGSTPSKAADVPK